MKTTNEATKKKTTNDKVREAVVNDLLDKIENDNVLPWQKPWKTFSQKNIRGNAYRGINQLITMVVSSVRGYNTPYWGTFDQIKKSGGVVKKGERSTVVTFFKLKKVTQEVENENGEKEKEEKKIPIMRYYRVFNLEQAEGIDMEKFEEELNSEIEDVKEAEEIIEGMPFPPKIVHVKGDKACYSPDLDTVTMPLKGQFKNEGEYYGTLFHELVHSTGHKDRLNRKSLNGKGKENYSIDEMIAEIGSNILLSTCGMKRDESNMKRSAYYVKNWMKIIKDDPKILFKAASEAQKAADLIEGKTEKGENKKAA